MSIISHEHEYLFIHIPKTGGTSIEQQFGEIVLRNRELGWWKRGMVYSGEVTGIWRTNNLKHARLLYFKNEYPAEYKRYYRWSVIRHPFDRMVSRYWHSRRFEGLTLDFETWCLNGFGGMVNQTHFLKEGGKVDCEIHRFEDGLPESAM